MTDLRQSTAAAPSRRRAATVAAVLVVPAAVYGWAVVLPWVRGEGLLQEDGRLLDFFSPALALLGALVALVLSGVALLSYLQRPGTGTRGSLAVHAAVVVLSVGLLAWFLSPAGAALNAAQFD